MSELSTRREVILNNYGSGKKSDMEQTPLESITTGFKRENLDIRKKIERY
jgi:hypothetical protein